MPRHFSHFTITLQFSKLRKGGREQTRFNSVFKVCTEFDDVTSPGKLFLVHAAATGNARSPTVASRVSGTANAEVDDDCKRCRPGIPATGCRASAIRQMSILDCPAVRQYQFFSDVTGCYLNFLEVSVNYKSVAGSTLRSSSDISSPPKTLQHPSTCGTTPPISLVLFNSICYLCQKRLFCRRFSRFVCLLVTKELICRICP